MRNPKYKDQPLCTNLFTHLGGDPLGEPYVVQLQGKGYTPLNALVFAQNEEDAKNRVLDGIQMELSNNVEGSYCYQRVKRLLGEVESGEISIWIEPLDKSFITKVPWAANDRF